MGDLHRATAAVTLIVLSATVHSTAQENSPTPQIKSSPENSIKGPPREPTVTVFPNHEVQGILGKEVRSAADENMGRVIDVIVDRTGQVRAAIIDLAASLASAVARSRLRGMRSASRPMQTKSNVLPSS